MNVLKGIAASPGVAIGRAYVIEDEEIVVTRIELPRELRASEVRRFKAAQKATHRDLSAAEAKVLRLLGKNHAKLIEAHRLILKDVLITKEVPQRIMREGVNAEFALSETLDAINKQFEKMEDEFFRERRHDLFDVGRRLLAHLMKQSRKSPAENGTGSIIIARNLLPSDTLSLQEAKMLGFAMDFGGKTSHTAILAQSLELPAVVGLSDVSRRIKTGDLVVLDGEQGIVIINPTSDAVAHYQRIQHETREAQKGLLALKSLPATTLDAKSFHLEVNLDSVDEAKSAAALDPDGVGLFRTECLFLNRKDYPGEQEQTKAYSAVLKAFDSKPVILRTADLGGDRLAEMGLDVPKDEANPFLGLRGIRLFLRHDDLFRLQLRAMLRAASKSRLRVLIPMISSVGELREVKRLLAKAQDELLAQGTEPPKKLELGIMVEVPSTAVLIDEFLPMVDFISIGTNDLIQYLLAVDRINEHVAQLYDPFHPAVIRILDSVIKAAHRHGKWVGVCGGMTSDPKAVPLLIGMGVDSLSVPPRLFLKIKQVLRSLRYSAAAKAVERSLSCSESDDIHKILAEILG